MLQPALLRVDVSRRRLLWPREMIHCADRCGAAKKERTTAPPAMGVNLRRAVASRCRVGERRQQQEVAVDDRLGDVDQLVAVVL